MAYKKTRYTRKRYARKTGYARRKYSYTKQSRKLDVYPWRSRMEDQQVNVSVRAAIEVKSGTLSASGTAQIHIYWIAPSTAANVIPASATGAIYIANYDTTGVAEQEDYELHYKERKLNKVSYKWVPANLQMAGGSTAAVTPSGIVAVTEIQTTKHGGPGSASINTDRLVNPLTKIHRPNGIVWGWKNSQSYLAEQTNSNYGQWQETDNDQLGATDCGATSFLIQYQSLPASTTLGYMYVDYSMSYRGRTLV